MTNHLPDWQRLADAAWAARSNARVLGKSAVGAAVQSDEGAVIAGCNVEHRFRSHDIHAETNAIGNAVAQGERKIVAVLVVAERKRFTPCGSCMDWIFELGGPECVVGYQREPNGKIAEFTAAELMPHYPLDDY